MGVKITTNALKVSKALGGIDEILNRATAATLRQGVQFGKREGARDIVRTMAAPMLKVSDMVSVNKKSSRSSRALIKDFAEFNQYMNWWEQEAEIIFSASSLRAMYFSPVDKAVSTRRGLRYGVTVKIFGKRIDTGGFHLRSGQGGMKRIDQAGAKYGPSDWVFKRQEDGSIKPYWFPSVADILRSGDTLPRLESKIGNKMVGYMHRNFNRYSHQIWKEIQILKM